MKIHNVLLVSVMASLGLLSTASYGEEQKIDRSNTLYVNNADEPSSLDPHKTTDMPSDDVQRQLFEGLIINSPNSGYRGGIAESWSHKNFKVWTFKLKQGLKWSDGTPLNAHDLEYSWKRLVNPETAGGYSSYLGDMQVVNAKAIVSGEKPVDELGARAIDDLTFEVVLDKPVPFFLDMMINTALSPVPKHVIEQHGNKWTHKENFVGNGAYVLNDWIVNEYVELVRNPNYIDVDKVQIPAVRLLPINSANDSLMRYEAGELDVSTVSPERFKQMKEKYGDQVKASPFLCTYYYEMNNERAPFNNKGVRQALSYLLDRELLANVVVGQGQTAAYQVVPPFTANYTAPQKPEWATWSKEKRAAKAKELLAKAGFDKDHRLVIPFTYRKSDLNQKIAIAVQSLYKEALGDVVELKLEKLEGKTYFANRNKGLYDMGVASWCADYNEASTFLNIFKNGNSYNRARYSNPAYDVIIDKTLAGETTEEERVKLYQQAQSILDEDMPVAPIYYYVALRMVKPEVKNFSLKDPLNRFYYKDWRLEGKK